MQENKDHTSLFLPTTALPSVAELVRRDQPARDEARNALRLEHTKVAYKLRTTFRQVVIGQEAAADDSEALKRFERAGASGLYGKSDLMRRGILGDADPADHMGPPELKLNIAVKTATQQALLDLKMKQPGGVTLEQAIGLHHAVAGARRQIAQEAGLTPETLGRVEGITHVRVRLAKNARVQARTHQGRRQP